MELTDLAKLQDTTESKTSHVAIEIPTDECIPTTDMHNESSIDHQNLAECPICCNETPPERLQRMPCCSAEICLSCISAHSSSHIKNGIVNIQCPSCPKKMNQYDILYNTEIPLLLRNRYQDLLLQELAKEPDSSLKLCPRCNYVTVLDKKDPATQRQKSRGSSATWVRCVQCELDWCWSCYAPAHPNQTCKEFKKKGDVESWAAMRRTDNNQRNAQRCPKCAIFIEKIDGCDHMACTKCHAKFCYRCGGRMILPNAIGHDAKYSVFGCKYKLYPDRPCLRWLVRGSILAGLIILAPIVLVLLIALVVIALPIVLIAAIFALPVYACIKCNNS